MSPIDNDPIDARIRAALGTPDLPDNGFTERVLRALPSRPRRWNAAQALLILVWTGTLAGLGLTLAMLGSSEAVSNGLERMDASAETLLGNPWTAFAIAAVLVSYGTALYAARAAHRRLG